MKSLKQVILELSTSKTQLSIDLLASSGFEYKFFYQKQGEMP
jgi:hypothetical protein